MLCFRRTASDYYAIVYPTMIYIVHSIAGADPRINRSSLLLSVSEEFIKATDGIFSRYR